MLVRSSQGKLSSQIEKIIFEMVLHFPYDERSPFQSEQSMSEDEDMKENVIHSEIRRYIYIYMGIRNQILG